MDKNAYLPKIPLDTTRNHIQLLELFPGMPEDKLTGILIYCFARPGPELQCCELHMGDQNQAFSITLNG